MSILDINIKEFRLDINKPPWNGKRTRLFSINFLYYISNVDVIEFIIFFEELKFEILTK